MLVAEILKDKGEAVHTIGPDVSLGEAARILTDRRVGALIVEEDDAVVGVLSERDIVRAVAVAAGDALQQPVSRHMTAEVIFAVPADTVDTLMGRMTDRRIRHLPVLRDGRLAGVVSIGDVVKSCIAEATSEAEGLRNYITAG